MLGWSARKRFVNFETFFANSESLVTTIVNFESSIVNFESRWPYWNVYQMVVRQQLSNRPTCC